jgi:hypothetical protein
VFLAATMFENIVTAKNKTKFGGKYVLKYTYRQKLD